MRYNRIGDDCLNVPFPELVRDLVRIPSINGQSEHQFGEFFRNLLDTIIPESLIRMEAEDREQRPAFIVLKSGQSRDWIILLGHYDTVGVSDYGELESLAFDPDALREALKREPRLTESERKEVEDLAFMWGRGALDMKAGIAALIEVIRALAQEPLPSVAMLVVPDEEGDSGGIRAALPVLLRELKDRRGRLAGVIKADFVEMAGAIYAGTIGKMLLNVYVRGIAGHAGKAKVAVSATSVMADIERFLARSRPLVNPAPVCLHMETLNPQYSTQTPVEGWMFFNILSASSARAGGSALHEILEASAEGTERVIGKKYGLPVRLLRFDRVNRAEGEPRRAALEWVRQIARDPGIYLYLSPPYYAPIGSSSVLSSRLGECVMRVSKRWNKAGRKPRIYLKPEYPFISDLSFFTTDAKTARTMQRFSPVALDNEPIVPGNRTVPVFDIGPYGQGGHSWKERVNVVDAEHRVTPLIQEVIREYYGG